MSEKIYPSYEQLHEEVGRIPGISRVSVTDDGTYPDSYTTPKIGIVYTNDEALDAARSYYDEHVCDNFGNSQVRATHEGYWEPLSQRVGARDLLDYFIGSEHIENAAARSHAVWRAGKQAAREDPGDPYRGYGPTRLKVQDLSPAERDCLNLPPGADPTKDVYHPLDLPFMQLSSDIQNKNVVPMAAACLAVGDFLIDDDTRVEELDAVLSGMATSPEKQAIVNMVTHVAWAASDVTLGGRPWKGAAENYHLYSRLTPDVQDLDAQATTAPLEYIRDQIAPIDKATTLLRRTVLREGGPFEDWWAFEWGLLSSASERYMPTAQLDRDTLLQRASLTIKYNNHYSDQTIETRLPVELDVAFSDGYLTRNANGGVELSPLGKQRLNDLTSISDMLHFHLIRYLDQYATLKDRYMSRPL